MKKKIFKWLGIVEEAPKGKRCVRYNGEWVEACEFATSKEVQECVDNALK